MSFPTGQASSKVQRGVTELDVAVPAGAKRLRISWRLRAAGSGWFWNLDEPTVTRSPTPGGLPRARPVVRGLRVLLRRGASFDLSEPAKVTLRVSRRGKRVATLRRSGRIGRNLFRIPRALLRRGAVYRVSVTAQDPDGDRSITPPQSVRFRYRGG